MAPLERTLDFLCERVLQTHADLGPAWPFHADPTTGSWFTTEDGNWCSGQWIESLRIVRERSGDRSLIEEARTRMQQTRWKLNRDDSFRSHQFYFGAARLAAAEDDPEMRALALEAAEAVRSMALPVNGAMPIGRDLAVLATEISVDNVVAVDNVHLSLMLDWYAYEQTGDERFLEGANRHLAVTERDFIRDDDSTIQNIEYDLDTGEVIRGFTLLGISDDSCWSRGQAWAIAGYLRAFETTRDPHHLDVAARLFDYYWKRSEEDHIPPWDLMATGEQRRPIDTSSAAIIVAKLARVAVMDDRPPETEPVVARLQPLLEGLCAHVTPVSADDDRPVGMLVDGCFHHPARFADNAELLWGDFWLLEALHCLDRGELPC